MSPPPVYPNGSLLADRFEIVRRIGEGGMGIVYEALDCERGTTVALKSITQPDPTAIFRFKREFRALADIVHPNLVPLYELVSTGDQWFFTMQLVEGTDLARYLRPPSKVASGVALDVVMTNADLEAKTESDPAVNAVTANQRVGSAAAIEARPVSISEMYDWAQVDWRRVRRTFAQLASAVDMIVQTSRLRDGSRCVTHIAEVQGYDPAKGYHIENVFIRRYHGEDEKGRVLSTFEPTGFIPKVTEEIRGHGLEIPSIIYHAAQHRAQHGAQPEDEGGGGHGH